MRVAHIGPRLARQGGPGGYLLQLHEAAGRFAVGVETLFPAPVPQHPPLGTSRLARDVPARLTGRWRSGLGRIKRHVVGQPTFYRPSDADVKRRGGVIEAMVLAAREALVEESRASVGQAFTWGADVFFCHDSATAERLLHDRPARAEVWLFQHAPFSLALYQAWSWALPERPWTDLTALPDVVTWTARETHVWKSVDRFVVPCREAYTELVRSGADPARAADAVDFVLTGGATGPSASANVDADRASSGAEWSGRVGVFLGNAQPYRGLDLLIAGVQRLTPSDPPGHVVVAGPPVDRLPRHPRLRPVGPTSDVAALLERADFAINVNRFSLFDLSTIEAAEAGKALLLSSTGGNLTLRDLGAGAVMLSDLDPDAVADGLRHMFSLDRAAVAQLGAASRACYERHLTLGAFWARHAALYARAAESTMPEAGIA